MSTSSELREVVVDARGRTTLGADFTGRYFFSILPTGELRLIPVVSVPTWELPILEGLKAVEEGRYGPSAELDTWLDEISPEDARVELDRNTT